MKLPKVQIIIPVYNAEKYLHECLLSIKEQTYEEWEAIIIDDASTDGSAKIIKEFAEKDERFKYFLQEKNSGVAATRNRALKMLSSEYAAFIDSDDYWEKDMLQKMIEKAESEQADVVQCRFIYDFPGGKTVMPRGAFNSDVVLEKDEIRKVYIKMMTGINMNHVCMKLVRTKLICGLEFDAGLKTAEDLQFCVRLFERVNKYCFINKAFYHYRRSENSLTGKGVSGKEKLKANRIVSKDIKKALKSRGMNKPFWLLLCELRPFIIILSKLFRMIREKIFAKK